MNIELTTEELELHKSTILMLPNETRIVQYDLNEDQTRDLLFVWEISDGKLSLIRDCKEHWRKATEEELRSSEDISIDDIAKYWIEVDPDSRKYSEYQIYSKALRSHFKYISCSGYLVKTNQNSFQFTTYYDADSNDVIKEMLYFIDGIKPIEYDDGRMGKRFSIMTDDLSESGVLSLWIFKDGSVAVDKLTYYRHRIIIEESSGDMLDNLKVVVKYLIQNEPYGVR